MTDRELMQQALYVFDLFYENGYDREDCFAVITALRERLARQDGDDTLFRQFMDGAKAAGITHWQPARQEPIAWGYVDRHGDIIDCITPAEHARAEGDYKLPLYTAPPPARQEQEPVAWHEPGAYGNVTVHEKWARENGWLPLYTDPQPCPTCEALARAVMCDQTGRA